MDSTSKTNLRCVLKRHSLSSIIPIVSTSDRHSIDVSLTNCWRKWAHLEAEMSVGTKNIPLSTLVMENGRLQDHRWNIVNICRLVQHIFCSKAPLTQDISVMRCRNHFKIFLIARESPGASYRQLCRTQNTIPRTLDIGTKWGRQKVAEL